MNFLFTSLTILTLIVQCSNCQAKASKNTRIADEKVPYEFVISRSFDDFTPSVSGATISVAKLDGDRLNIELIFRVGRRLSFSMFTDDAALDFHPVWSPDEQSLVFDSKRNQKIAIWELRLSENKPKLLIGSDAGMCFAASFSPDSTKIAYTKTLFFDPNWWVYYITPPVKNIRPEQFQIVLRTIETGEDKILTFGMIPAFSPDGKKIAYSSFNGSDWDLWVMTLSSGNKLRLTQSGDNDFYPSWSPDGQWIAFCRENPINSSSDIWVVRSDGSSLMSLTDTKNHNESAPFWTADGIYIDTDSGENTPYDIALIPPEILPTTLSTAENRNDMPTKNATIEILNSTRIKGLAARTQKLLEKNGFEVKDIGNSRHERNLYKGKIYYKPGFREIAKRIADIIPGTQRLYESKKFKYDIVIVLGRNTHL